MAIAWVSHGNITEVQVGHGTPNLAEATGATAFVWSSFLDHWGHCIRLPRQANRLRSRFFKGRMGAKVLRGSGCGTNTEGNIAATNYFVGQRI